VAENQPLRGTRIDKNRMTSNRSFEEFNSRLREFIGISRDRDLEPARIPLNRPSAFAKASADEPGTFSPTGGEGWDEGLRFMERPDVISSEPELNQLALALFALQFAHVEPYRRFCETRRITPDKVARWSEIPAVPAAAFKELELSSLRGAERTNAFHSSGTTAQRTSRHFHNSESLATYEASLLPWFKAHLLPEAKSIHFVILTPSPALAPHSSLVHMLETVRREFGSQYSRFTGNVDATGAWTLDMDATLDALHKSMETGRPLALLGTAFSFVHLLDQVSAHPFRFALPSGSRVMETGGYKGRSRQLPRSQLHALITRYLGIPPAHIVCEYGMSELSSQAYDRQVQNVEPETMNESRVFRFPPWARARVISPETGAEVAEGETGLIQVCDLANVRSVMMVQTEDLAVRLRNGFELLGRAELAEPRGCSLMNT
jgi:hypothetical protein